MKAFSCTGLIVAAFFFILIPGPLFQLRDSVVLVVIIIVIVIIL